jgi:putative hemolysin
MQADGLEALIAQHPDCIIAAYADISTGVTLLTAGTDNVPREALNELCAEAAISLGSHGLPPLGAETCQVAVKIVDHAVFVYVRSPADDGDALVCMCHPSVDIDPFVAAARDVIAQMA